MKFCLPGWGNSVQIPKRPATALAVAAAVVCLSACAAEIRNAVPVGLADNVEVADFGRVRSWGDAEIADIDRLAEVRLKQMRAARPEVLSDKRRQVSYLAISGGGSDGAFGAGFLNGWTATGKRPEFEIVTGVSTGALIAPFAFLGSRYDRQVREIYTHYSTDDLIKKQVLAGLLGGSAVSDTTPLRNLIAKYVTESFMEEIAKEYEKGRRLFVGTTNADQERPVIWDLGRIAQRRTPESLAMFRQVLLASAALPGLFPPVHIAVHDNSGKSYEEMHVDGGVTDNTFLLPLHLQLDHVDRIYKVNWQRNLYIIANAKTTPTRKVVNNTTFEIAGRSISTLIRQQLEGDLLKLYLRAKNNKIKYRLASIPATFNEPSSEPFDIEYMKKLYRAGYEAASAGYQWKQKPPGI